MIILVQNEFVEAYNLGNIKLNMKNFWNIIYKTNMTVFDKFEV